MYKNPIRGIRCRTSGQMIASSISIPGTGCKSCGCARKAVELTSGDLTFGVQSRLRAERLALTARQKSAKGVVSPATDEGPNGPRKVEGLVAPA